MASLEGEQPIPWSSTPRIPQSIHQITADISIVWIRQKCHFLRPISVPAAKSGIRRALYNMENQPRWNEGLTGGVPEVPERTQALTGSHHALTSYLEADLDFVLHSLLQDEGLFLKGLQVACWVEHNGKMLHTRTLPQSHTATPQLAVAPVTQWMTVCQSCDSLPHNPGNAHTQC